MREIVEIAAVPVYVLIGYKEFISERELIFLLHYSAIKQNGKKSWEIIAERMGYTNVSYLEQLIKSLQDRGLIQLEGFSVDPSALYTKCLEIYIQPQQVELIPRQAKPAKKDRSIYFGIWNEINKIPHGGNKWQWVAEIEKVFEQGAGEEDIIAFVYAVNEYFRKMDGNKLIKRTVMPYMLVSNFQEWLKNGKQKNNGFASLIETT